MKVNIWTFIMGGIGLYIGYRLQKYSNEQSEKKIIQAIKDEIANLKSKQQEV